MLLRHRPGSAPDGSGHGRGLDRGAEVNGRDKQDRTALHWAAEHGHTEMLAVLLDLGADITVVDVIRRETPLFLAASRGHIKTAVLLRERGAVEWLGLEAGGGSA